MNKKIAYLLMFMIPGIFVSLIISTFILFQAGLYSLFLFPEFPDKNSVNLEPIFIYASFIVPFLLFFSFSIFIGIIKGKKHEADEKINKKHLAVSVVVTTVVATLVFLIAKILRII